jgi:hypothetical protein
MISRISRDTGEPRFWVGDHAERPTCMALMAEHIPAHRTQLWTAEGQSSRGSHPSHATVRHGGHEWAREDAGDGRREVHGHTCEGAGAAVSTLSWRWPRVISSTALFATD